MLTFDTRRVAWVLGFMGLIPFALCAVAVMAGLGTATFDPLGMFVNYSAVILSFLSGTLWSNAEHLGLSRASALTMILSNIFCLAAWLALVMGNSLTTVLLLMVAFPLLCVAEARVKDSLHPSYMRLRTYLTWMVFATHMAVALVLL